MKQRKTSPAAAASKSPARAHSQRLIIPPHSPGVMFVLIVRRTESRLTRRASPGVVARERNVMQKTLDAADRSTWNRKERPRFLFFDFFLYLYTCKYFLI